jgi:hypothetical protein
MKKLIILPILFFTVQVTAQNEKDTTVNKEVYISLLQDKIRLANEQKKNRASWLDKFSIVKSFADADSKEEPAIFSMTFPKDTSSSFLIDIGVGYPIHESTLTSGELVTEFHRNTEIDKEVKNFQFGYSGEFILNKPKELPSMKNLLDPLYIPPYVTAVFTTALKYRWDGQERSHGYTVSGLMSPFVQGGDYKLWLGSTKYNEKKNFGFYLLPAAGIELQQNLRADSAKMIGFVGRGVFKLNIGFGGVKPNDKIGTTKVMKPIKTWWFSFDGALRYDAVGKQFYENRLHPMITTAMDIYLVRSPVKLIVGASFTWGDNPVEGFTEFKFEKQQFWVIALKIQK